MDFSTQLKNRKKSLRPTKTYLTTNLGEKFEIDGENVSKKLGTGFSFVVDTKPDLEIVEIVPGLFLSSQDPVFSEEILQKYNIKNILSLGIEISTKFNGFSYFYEEILDIPEFFIDSCFEKCFQIIENCRNSNILVHCNAGVSRSPTIVIAYLIYSEKMTFQEALDKVKGFRSCVRPNEGFVKQLRQFEVKICKKL